MKKTLIILGSVFLLLIVIAVIGFGIIAGKGNALDKESKAYVDEVTPIILSDLKQQTLFKYATPELIKSAPQEDIDRLFNWFADLGKFKQYKESSGQANISYTTQGGKVVSAQYIAQVEFETGPATVTIAILKRDNGWQIHNFNINSMALIKK